MKVSKYVHISCKRLIKYLQLPKDMIFCYFSNFLVENQIWSYYKTLTILKNAHRHSYNAQEWATSLFGSSSMLFGRHFSSSPLPVPKAIFLPNPLRGITGVLVARKGWVRLELASTDSRSQFCWFAISILHITRTDFVRLPAALSRHFKKTKIPHLKYLFHCSFNL